MRQALWRDFMLFRELTTFMAGPARKRSADRKGAAPRLSSLAVESVEAVEAQLAGIEDMDEAGPAVGLLDDAAEQVARDGAALQLLGEPGPGGHDMAAIDVAVVLGDAAV